MRWQTDHYRKGPGVPANCLGEALLGRWVAQERVRTDHPPGAVDAEEQESPVGWWGLRSKRRGCVK